MYHNFCKPNQTKNKNNHAWANEMKEEGEPRRQYQSTLKLGENVEISKTPLTGDFKKKRQVQRKKKILNPKKTDKTEESKKYEIPQEGIFFCKDGTMFLKGVDGKKKAVDNSLFFHPILKRILLFEDGVFKDPQSQEFVCMGETFSSCEKKMVQQLESDQTLDTFFQSGNKVVKK